LSKKSLSKAPKYIKEGVVSNVPKSLTKDIHQEINISRASQRYTERDRERNSKKKKENNPRKP